MADICQERSSLHGDTPHSINADADHEHAVWRA
jgi:hypothetical protein